MIHTWYFKSITSSSAKLMEGDGDDEDNDIKVPLNCVGVRWGI